MIAYVGRVSPPINPIPPEGALYWDYVNGNLYGSQPVVGKWSLIGGNISTVPVILASGGEINATTTAAGVSALSPTLQLYAVSISMESTGLAGSGHTVTATLSWTSPITTHTQTETMALSGGEIIVVETFPILAAAGTEISVTFSYGGGATNDPYTYAVSIVQMPGGY